MRWFSYEHLREGIRMLQILQLPGRTAKEIPGVHRILSHWPYLYKTSLSVHEQLHQKHPRLLLFSQLFPAIKQTSKRPIKTLILSVCPSVRPWWKSICKIKPVYKEGCEDSHYAKTIPISETIIKILRLVKIRLRATSMDGLKKRLFPWTKARPLPRGDQTAV